jgi:putative sterol carrier protein
LVLLFPSDEWIKALGQKLNESVDYARSAKDWEGDFLFVIEPDDAYADTSYLFLGLYHGRSTGAEMTDGSEHDVQFTIAAPYSTWRRVIEGKLEPIQGIMMRQLKLEGDMRKILRYPRAAKEIVGCCATIPTVWA